MNGRSPTRDDAKTYLPFVRKVATRIARRLPSSVDVEDLVSAGTVGLIEALDRYDPNGGRNFETYAEFRIKGAIFDELRRGDPVNRSARSTQQKMEGTTAELTKKFGRPPTPEEMATAMNTSVEQVVGSLGQMESIRVVSMDSAKVEVLGDELSAEEQLSQAQQVQAVRAALSGLNEKQQMILNLYYVEELTLQEIGEVLKVTESRVSQILSQLRGQLRKVLPQRQEV